MGSGERQTYEAPLSVCAIAPAAGISVSFCSFIVCLFAISFSHDYVNIKGKMPKLGDFSL